METEIIETCDGEEIVSLEKTKRVRVANPDCWGKNVRKKLRNTGQAYVTTRGKYREATQVRPKDCSKCKKECNTNFPDSDRQRIHSAYWGLGDVERRKLFITTLVEEVPVTRHRVKGDSRRNVTRQYFFRKGRTKIAVCKGFFLATLDISESVVCHIVKTRDETSYFPRESLQGKGKKGLARPEEARERIRNHIQSYIVVQDEPNKKRRKVGPSAMQCVIPGMNVKKMYMAYVDACNWNDVRPEKIWLYRDIFNKEFDITFLDEVEAVEDTLEEPQRPGVKLAVQPENPQDPVDEPIYFREVYYTIQEEPEPGVSKENNK